MVLTSAFEAPRASWDLVHSISLLLEFRYMQNAFLAGLIIATLAGVAGWLMIVRSQTYAGHTMAMAGFPGATGAVLIGISPLLGFFAFCVGAAIAIHVLAPSSARRSSTGSAVVGTVQAFALALGLLFASMTEGFSHNVTTSLFGTFIGITSAQVVMLAVTATIALTVLGVIWRPLLLASIDDAVARAAGIHVSKYGLLFVLVLAMAVAQTGLLTGTLLVFALLVGPPSSAQLLTPHPGKSMLIAVMIGIGVTWLGLALAYFSVYPVGFYVTTLSFGTYVLARTYVPARAWFRVRKT